MKSKKAYTLVEVLVAIAVSTILIGIIGTSFFFMTDVNNKLVKNTETCFRVTSLRNSIRSNPDKYDIDSGGSRQFTYDEDARCLVYKNSEIIFTDIDRVDVEFYDKADTETRGFLRCKITYRYDETKIKTMDFAVKAVTYTKVEEENK